MNLELFSTLITDGILSLALLFLFSYLSRISNGIPGIALWGIGHFLYTIGAILIDATVPFLDHYQALKWETFILVIGNIVSAIGLILLSYSIVIFTQKKYMPTWFHFFTGITTAIVLVSWMMAGSNFQSSGFILSTLEILFLITLFIFLVRIHEAPSKLPARLMMLFSIPLAYTYSTDLYRSITGNYDANFDWVHFDLFIWYLLNFCMLMMASFKAAEGFKRAALLDPLTNILNRRGLRDAVDTQIQKKQPLAIIAFDLDHFKATNDTYGHAAGDLILQKVSQATLAMLDDEVIFARTGGEEFLIVIKGKTAENASELAEELRKAIENLDIRYSGQKIRTSASFGVAYCPSLCRFSNITQQADLQLYSAKENGRNQVKSCMVEPNSFSRKLLRA